MVPGSVDCRREAALGGRGRPEDVGGRGSSSCGTWSRPGRRLRPSPRTPARDLGPGSPPLTWDVDLAGPLITRSPGKASGELAVIRAILTVDGTGVKPHARDGPLSSLFAMFHVERQSRRPAPGAGGPFVRAVPGSRPPAGGAVPRAQGHPRRMRPGSAAVTRRPADLLQVDRHPFSLPVKAWPASTVTPPTDSNGMRLVKLRVLASIFTASSAAVQRGPRPTRPPLSLSAASSSEPPQAVPRHPGRQHRQAVVDGSRPRRPTSGRALRPAGR
jgi:hypothetical protein